MTAIVLKKELEERLEHLAQERCQPVSAVVSDMVQACLEVDEWHRHAINKAIERADRGEARFVDGDAVDDWLESWGTDHERNTPACG